MAHIHAGIRRRQWLAAGGLLLAQQQGVAFASPSAPTGTERKSPLVFAVITRAAPKRPSQRGHPSSCA